MAKILVVTKDLAEFLMYRPVVELLQKANHRVTVVAEGLSFQKWSDVEVPYLVGVGAGDISPEVFQPDLVLTGLGAPINLGEKFGLDANKLGVKLGFVEDIWGVHRCSKAVPDFVCTLDPFGKALIASHKPYNGRTIHVYVTGSPALDRLSKVKPPNPSDLPMMQVLEKHEKVVLLAGQDESTTPMVEGLVAALDQAWENYILIPRL
ncbi:MAG: hypothetical protein KGI72_06085, partial [Patescibacteria group bacterium]|nr:hypothetical protein [Patescibacteria group bacterium]